MIIHRNMYLGTKGYTIPKECLHEVQQRELKRTLTFSTRQVYGEGKTVYAYRESTTKYYVPRFHGIYKYGVVDSMLPSGNDIRVPFHGSIRGDQQKAVDAFMKTKCGLLELPCGFGKTIVALYLIHALGKKTMVIVHKEFLLEQWIERIREFLPTATVGRIQGDVVDTQHDIVIGMLQSISTKQYPPELFHEFGFTIIDETHHIAAEVFSSALFKLVTPCMLGLSATMERKDGLSSLFKLFLGDIVYSAQREKTSVMVHKVLYHVDDTEFNEVIKNFKGETNYTSMIKKISEYNPRKECILTLLTKVLQLPTTGQVMILSHTKSLLTYLHDAIVHRGLGTVGYYIGGLKSSVLKDTEDKKIVLATFAMAEEALDIKTLTTLVLASPKTDVVQAVGRILRIKHEMPLIIDIVDSHSTFINQWKKRRAYYRSQGYDILETTYETYPLPARTRSSCVIQLG